MMAQQAELQRRAAAASALQQWSYQQQVLNSLNRPTTTNCSVTGGFINCQKLLVGGQPVKDLCNAGSRMAELVETLRRLQGRAKTASSEWARSVPAWLAFLGGSVAGAIMGLFAGASREWTGGLIGLLGVVLGGVIAWATNFALERERRKSQIAMATWAERVRAHQEALARWSQVRDAALEENPDKRLDTISEARDWWIHNCLYMSEEARDGFSRACTAANGHQDLLRASPKEARAEYEKRIDSLPRVLIKGAAGHIPDEVLRELWSDCPRGQEAEKT
jgi:hypothetical protein